MACNGRLPAGKARKVMAKLIQIEPDVFLGYQLAEADFASLAARGFRSVVNHLPDGEVPDQMSNRQAHAAALRQGLAFHHLPVIGANITDDDIVEEFVRLIDDLPRPVLLFCRSGTRGATLWTQAAAQRLGVAAALEMAARAGYDLEVLRDTLVEQAGARGQGSDRPALAAE
jgi:sulfide:quinone oxidoreductase